MSKSQKFFNITAVLALVVALIGVMLPRQAGQVVEPQGLSPINFSNPVVMNQTLAVKGTASFAKDVTFAGNITAASIVTNGDASLVSVATTGNITDTGNLIVTGASALNGGATVGVGLTSTGVLSVAGNAAIAGNMIVTGTQLFVGQTTESTNIIHSSALITPTNSGTVTPAAKLVSMNPATDVTVTMAACTTGMETILYNQANFAVLIQDTGNGVLAGAQTLGQYDALMLACIGTKWVQVSAVSAN